MPNPIPIPIPIPVSTAARNVRRGDSIAVKDGKPVAPDLATRGARFQRVTMVWTQLHQTVLYTASGTYALDNDAPVLAKGSV